MTPKEVVYEKNAFPFYDDGFFAGFCPDKCLFGKWV